MAALRRAAQDVADHAEEMVKRLAAGYLPEMRDHDIALLRRIVDQDIDVEERLDMRLHLAARKIAAHVALEERSAIYVA